MSFVHPDPIAPRPKAAAIFAVAVTFPILLDALHVIRLGDLGIVPFLLLLAAAPVTWKRQPERSPDGGGAEARP